MKVLVACEESQEVCKAFRAKGHEAYSCDILPSSGGHPEWHIQDDAIKVAYREHWDLMIAHPPCTYMSNAGARRMYKGGVLQKERLSLAENAKEFFMELNAAPIQKIAIENPVPLKVIALPKYSQIIQPYQFGEPYSKKTLLWLKGLPFLNNTNLLTCWEPYLQSGAKGASLSKIRGKSRSKTFPGIAKAMAEQWG
jgi:hypothetical protein